MNDSIFFVTGGIDKKYFVVPLPPAKVIANEFRVEANVSYPQMCRILFKSDKGRRIYRRGEYFIDATTNTMTVDFLAEDCIQVNGATATEYLDKFIPFFYGVSASYECQQRKFDDLVRNEALEYDSTLYSYVKANPASYVGLWSLIERFSLFGHSQLRERILTTFSKDVKASPLWQTLREDLRNAPFKQGAVFPSFLVKGVTQPEHQLFLPKAKYTLVDFWFSRCRPCLEAFPTLKRIYGTYQAKGFEIVSISTDKTQEVELWKKRVQEYELPWFQYLDENAVAANKLLIRFYPATFLIDENGKVLLRDITPQELEKFLALKLK